MSENTRLNVWERNNVPVLEFCNLPRAAELLSCQVNDLIHFAEIGIVEFCLELNGYEAALMMMREGGDFSDWEKKYPVRALKYINKSPISYFTPNASWDVYLPGSDIAETPKQLYHCENKKNIRSPLILLSGLWALMPMSPVSSFYRNLKVSGKADFHRYDFSFKEANMPYSHVEFENNDWVILAMNKYENHYSLESMMSQSISDVIGTIKIDDIYITRYQIEKLDNGIGKELPSYVNGGISSPDVTRRVHGNVEASATKREAVYKAAIYWLLNDPESCNGKRGKLTLDAWADKIVAERTNPKTKVELGKDKIKECLSSSKAGRF